MPVPEETLALSPGEGSPPQPEAHHETPPRAYNYPHATDHPPVSPIPDDSEHEVKSYGGAPDGGT